MKIFSTLVIGRGGARLNLYLGQEKLAIGRGGAQLNLYLDQKLMRIIKMDQAQFDKLFITRAACLLYDLCETDNHCGLLGGNAPAYFDDKRDKVNDPDARYYFYLTVVSPVNGKMISIFLPSYVHYLKNNIYPNCAIKVFEHEVFPESQFCYYEMFEEEPAEKKTEYQKNFDYSKPTIKKTFLSEARLASRSKTESEPSPFLQVGGHPFLIQKESFYYENVTNNGYQFFFSVDEDGYLSDTIQGNFPFNYGAVYFYAKMNDGDISDVIPGFWQFS